MDTIELGPDDPSAGGEISYAVGQTQWQRIAGVVAAPVALGIASLVVAMASLMITEPTSEIGDVALFTRIGNPDGNLLELRWASGLRALVALIALIIAVVAARLLVGQRATVRIAESAPEADDSASLDAIEAAAIAALPVPPQASVAIVGSAVLVSLVSVVLNLAAWWYAMAAHIPQQGNTPLGF